MEKIKKTFQKSENRNIYFFLSAISILLTSYYTLLSLRVLDSFILEFAEVLVYILANIIQLFNQNIFYQDNFILLGGFKFNVNFGCEGTEPIILFTLAILSFPANWKAKLTGVILGGIIVFTLNIIRLLSLFYIGISHYSVFDLMHNDLFPFIIIMLELAIWIFWIKWSVKNGFTKINSKQELPL